MTSFDFDAGLFGPIYDAGLGTDASLIVPGTAGGTYGVTIIDKTAGTVVEEQVRGSPIAVQTIRPVARVRESAITDLGLAISDLEGAELKIRTVTWKVKAYRVLPSPSGPGEVEIILLDQDE